MSGEQHPDDSEQSAHRDDTRDRLLQATCRIILERGITAVRIDDVCAEVGVTKGSLYWHFSNRRELIRQALVEQLDQLAGESTRSFRESVESASGDKDAYLASLAPSLANPFDPDEVERRWQRIELMAASRHDPEFASVMHEVQTELLRTHLEVLALSAEKGLLREGIDPRALAILLQAVSMGSNMISLVGDEAPTAEAWFGLVMFLVEQLYPEG